MAKRASQKKLTRDDGAFLVLRQQVTAAKEVRAWLTPAHYDAFRRLLADAELGPSLRAIDHALNHPDRPDLTTVARMAALAGVPRAHAETIAADLDLARDDAGHVGWDALVIIGYWPEDDAGWKELEDAAAGIRPPTSPLRGIASTRRRAERGEGRPALASPPPGRSSAA